MIGFMITAEQTTLEDRLQALEQEQAQALALIRLKFSWKAIIAVLAVVITLGIGMLPVLLVLSASGIAIVLGVIILAFAIYFAIMFGRLASIKGEISETRKQIKSVEE
jgi:ABC-type multidrug transport system fused ATPase/permease subunit